MENSRRTLPIPYATFGILIVLLIVFLVETFTGGSTNARVLLNMGAMNNLVVASRGQFWRLFTAQFLHIGWLHLASNAVMIYYIGQYLEPIVGSWRFLLIYLLSGVGGNLLSFAYGNDYSLSAGASTALFGLFGAIIALYFKNRNVPGINVLGRQALALAFINLFLDLFMQDIDILGHIGGLIAGFLLGIIAGNKHLGEYHNKIRILSAVALILYCVWCFRLGMVITR